MARDEIREADPPLRVYRGAPLAAKVMLGVFMVIFVWVAVGAAIERNPLLVLISAGAGWLVIPFAIGRRARVVVWNDHFAVRTWSRWREYSFDECSEFEAKALPGPGSGLFVRFVHRPDGHLKHPKSVSWWGYNSVLPQLRGGASRLARDLNQYRENWLATEGVQEQR